jgi:hypothetical protein
MADRADEDFAAELVGTHVLVGLTHLDHNDNVLRKEQFHGTVIRASVDEGVILVAADGQQHRIPLDSEAFRPADPGEYRLRSTGEVVVDPAWLATWIVRPPEHQ